MEIIISNSMGEFVRKVQGEIIRVVNDFGNHNGLCEAIIKVDGEESRRYVLHPQC